MKVRLRTKEYEVLSPTFDQIERLELAGVISKIPKESYARDAMFSKPHRDAIMEFALAAITPSVTRDELGKEIAPDNVEALVAAMMGASNIERKERPAGEA
jgi:hypothetical protein